MDGARSLNHKDYNIESIDQEHDGDYSDDRELVNDSYSTKVLDNTCEEPRDRYGLVYILFYLYGITSLAAWNFIITPSDYWMYKFRDVTPSNLTVHVPKTQFQVEFTSYLNVGAAVPNLIFLVLNSFYGHLVSSLKARVQGSLVVVTVCFLITTAFVPVDTDDWQKTFFIITMVNVVIMSAASAVFVGSLVGVATKFSEDYLGAIISGQSLGGITAALAQILSLAFKMSAPHSALLYFIMADIILVVSLVSYVLLYKVDFFKFHISRSFIVSNTHRNASMVVIMKKIWVNAFSMFAVFVVSMSVYPSVTVLIESHPVTTGTDWNNIYFVPVVNYLIFNCGDCAGRIAAALIMRPTNQWVVACCNVCRAVFVPLLMMCNAQPRKYLPVLFPWDYQYISLMILFSFSNGYLTNVIITNTIRVLELHEREKASGLMATMLSVGMAVGAAIGLLLVQLL